MTEQTKGLAISFKTKDILSYDSEVWASADVLRSSVGLKNSEFPDYMMPFFALRMVESRLVRKYNEVVQDTSLTSEEDRIAEIKETAGFYNSVIIEDKITLADIVKNDKTFYTDLTNYLNAFDQELKNLLGIINGDRAENLNIAAVIESLRKKNSLFGYATAWAKIDFSPYDNSEITTLEEHIKRKWADMSAETAGEQYTPDDIINLISELIVTIDFKTNYPYKIYDMTCGGGNMLYGVDDKIKKLNAAIKTETYGQELRGSLYALAKIESMFRPDSTIEHGNTLTNDKFSHKQFDFGVANPPYGVSWKEEQFNIENDQTKRFGSGGYPSVADGQLLFIQHMLAKLNESGIAFIVLNGSPLFSGDAGSGESNIRKWILEQDYLEALIQLPTHEFFNTGITTYIWCLNKNKKEDRQNKILCINAENEFVKLKKNKGHKSKEITLEKAKNIAQVYKTFIPNEFSKVLSKYDFYFNKQSLKKLEKDDEFGAFLNGEGTLKIDVATVSDIKIYERDAGDKIMPDGVTINLPLTQNTKEEVDRLNVLFKGVDLDEQNIVITSNDFNVYSMDENHMVNHFNLDNSEIKKLGYGNIKIKAIYKKPSKTNDEQALIDIVIEPVWTKDEEKIPYSPKKEDNDKSINEFMAKWVSEDTKDYVLLDSVIGVEINFNSVFPKKITIRSTADILAEIAVIDKELDSI